MIERRWIPSTSALLAFESSARLNNFSRAAAELNTSQSAISRHIATLESRLRTRLFARSGRSLELTADGDRFYRAVLSGLEAVQSAAMAIAHATGDNQLTLACTHEISHLYLLPRFEALQQAVGEETRIRIMTIEYDVLEALMVPSIDLIFAYKVLGAAPDEHVVALPEAVTPICSPGFAEENHEALARGVSGWFDLPFLENTRPNEGWITWDEWFGRIGTPAFTPRYTGFGNYVYLLEAAAAGRGLALGWHGMIERHLEAGTLVPALDRAISTDRALYAVLTRNGRDREVARTCLNVLDAA
ncbi:MAG: LysR family transcriptional regulator [Rhodospirillales bacterium]|nr:LysR family transcriptional regulator [Rhodospirillales bacterium]